MYIVKSYDELSKDELLAILRARVDVFVVEQNCPYPEIDDVDNDELTQHVFLFREQQLAAYARCYKKNEQYSAFGRVLVAQQFRGEGLATKLVQMAIDTCLEHWPDKAIMIGAQCYLTGFYQQFGFENVGDDYLEDGIPHQDMCLR
ncbi:GNAT family N-acetyltransferase [Pseudoalteromonas sp. SSMSWG5]|jgi:ElaA protein|uniref:GNAT family N-acetyltransferase n=1 Tax=Pseudoalteromonas TaxID=53246 RepID=UPI000EC128D6|nr:MULTISPECIES: GNAT family N-acetyltransferase [unclassified Pseudoalteromonas]HCV02005.1 GNAT family N-acetyltransferase [Pseudoalteromonas sp.]MCF2902018.1 GNAT family N-acetyltransferase [Pseudoalteromonas sp. OFAV1]MCF2919318.1 GNAT family N-acetyltransferase [Pseudoalteromonas sp. APAL1]MCO7248301.1 GNAT family N-acetyltransferase [Pseudoalteromonas sp. Ps84H-4]TMO46275.1 GNAT family N-acetyltransferase [Pseudoalteromonas sp. S4389]